MKSISYNKFVSFSIFLSIAIVIALFLITTSYFHLNNLEKSIKNDSKTLTNLIFQNVYQVMKSGGTKKEIEEVIKKIESDLPNIISVKLIRNTPFEIKEIRESFNLQNKKLLNSYNELKIISDTDTLTGIFNRKKFDEFSNLAINV